MIDDVSTSASDSDASDGDAHRSPTARSAGSGTAPQGLPPTAAASVPSLVDDSVLERASGGRPVAGDGPPAGFGARPSITSEVGIGGRRGARGERPPTDRSVRPALAGLIAAVVALAMSEIPRKPVLVLLCWILAVAGTVTALVSGNRARYRITNHPGRRRGLAGAVTALMGGLAVLIAMSIGVHLVVRSAPLGEAPLLGRSGSIERLRWGFQRLRLVQGNGWHPVARDPGTCWVPQEAGAGDDRAGLDRIEEPLRRTSCGGAHTHEVLEVYAIDARADAPYDAERIRDEALERCGDEWGGRTPAGGRLLVEMATEVSWGRGDHDVVCILESPADRPLRGG